MNLLNIELIFSELNFYRQLQNRDNLSSDEYFAVSAMCAMLTCGPVFDINAISDDKGYAFGWLDALIGSQNDKVSLKLFLI